MRSIPIAILLIAGVAACARPQPPPRRQQFKTRATFAAVATASKPPNAVQLNFVSSPDADVSFLQLLQRADAVPLVVASQTGIGYIAESEADKLLVFDSNETPFLFHRRLGKRVASEALAKRNWLRVNLYDPIATMYEQPAGEEVELNFDRLFDLEQDIRVFLAISNPDVVRTQPQVSISIPADVLARDMKLEASETLDKSYCLKAPLRGHCLAVYATSRPDQREARLVVSLYDIAWSRIGSTGRNPGSWAENMRDFLTPFEIEALFNVDGLDSPIFVTTAFTMECPCTGFRLHTFLADGRFATIRVPNGRVANRTEGGSCNCTI